MLKNSKRRKKFAVYDQNQFIDDQAFKALWIKHQAEIEKLASSRQT
jgi:hypothetical protein